MTVQEVLQTTMYSKVIRTIHYVMFFIQLKMKIPAVREVIGSQIDAITLSRLYLPHARATDETTRDLAAPS